MTSAADDELFAFRTNIVVTASAGTGKTFRLVTLYVLLTLGLTSRGEDDDVASPPVSPTKIAATTFSRAAAAEIRERVERVLRAVADARFDAATAPYLAVLVSRAERTRSPSPSSPVMRDRARVALAELPHALIDTLHGLAGRVVRAVALDMGMTPGYAILDDDAARTSTDAAAEKVLSGAHVRGDRAAMDLLDAGGGLGTTRTCVADFLDRADEEGVPPERLDIADFGDAARKAMLELIEVCDRLASVGSRTFGDPARVAADTARRWIERHSSEEPASSPSEKELADAFEPLFTKRSPVRPTPPEEAFLAFRDWVKGETHAHRARRLAAFVAASDGLSPRTEGVRSLLSQIAAQRAEERRRAGVLGFGDLLRTARDAVRDRPTLARGAREMFDVLLVDEFQDTSRVQRDLVYLLREKRSRAAERPPGSLPAAHDLESSGLLVVGDRKQSIYGFRGADVTVFARVCADLAGVSARAALRLGDDFEVPEAPNATLVTLYENRRSHPRILEFVNAFADEDFDASSPYPFDIRYAASEHLVPADGDHGGDDERRVVIVEDSGEITEDSPSILRGASGALREAIVAAGLVDDVVRRRATGASRFGDVAILTRKRATLPFVEMALARLDIPYVVAGRGLFETREVRDVFAVLRLMVDPDDRHALATVLRGPAVGLSDLCLALLSVPGRGLLGPEDWSGAKVAAALALVPDDRERLAAFSARLVDLRHTGANLGPADAIRYAAEKLDLDRVLAALPHAPERFGNLERLVDLAVRRGGSLPSFVRWLDRQIADQSDEREGVGAYESNDAVLLMTIHASKGLEMPIVVLLDLGAAVRATPVTLALVPPRAREPARLAIRHVHERGGTLFTPPGADLNKENQARELAERRRLTYVAMTRAKERLFLVVPKTPGIGSAALTLKRTRPRWHTLPGVVVESAGPYLSREPRERSPAVASQPEPLVALRGADLVLDGPLGISVTPLSTFSGCARRYRLLHELDLEPPSLDGIVPERSQAGRDQRRALGTAAHRVLERWPLERWGESTDPREVAERMRAEAPSTAPARSLDALAKTLAAFLGGAYASKVRDARPRVHREERFVVPIASERGALLLRGTIDLLLRFSDGTADVVDYKSSLYHDLGGHDFQLRAYAVAARRTFGARRVRVGVVNIAAGTDPVLTELNADALDAFEQELVDLRSRFMEARATTNFAGVERSRCEALRCGFLRACHGA